MFSTPLICCSIGVTTVEATTSALAPGYWPDTVMVGGAISGYCATGSRKNATPPRITNTIETTEAKIGRSIKKCEMRIGFGRGYFGVCGGLAPCAGTAPGLPSSCGVTFWPGRARISPFTITRSSGPRPPLITRKLSPVV